MPEPWTPPEADKVTSAWTPPASDRVKSVTAKPQMTPSEFAANMDLRPKPAGQPGVNPPAPSNEPDPGITKVSLLLAKSPDDVVTALGGDPSKMKDADKQSLFGYVKDLKSHGPVSGMAEAFSAAVPHGFGDPILGATQLLAHAASGLGEGTSWGPGAESYKNLADLQVRARDLYYRKKVQDYPITSAVGQMVGQVPYALLAPESVASGSAARLTTLGSVGDASLFGAAMGAAQPVVGPDFLRDKALQTSLGSVAGAGGQVLTDKVAAPLISKSVAGFRGKLGLPSVSKELQATADTLGIPIDAGNLTPNPVSLISRATKAQAEAPILGTSGRNMDQVVKSNEAASNLLGGLKASTQSTPFSSQPEIAQAGLSGDRNALRILGMFQNAGDDPGRIAQAETNAQLWTRQQVANGKYAEATALAPQGPNPTEASNISSKAQSLLDSEIANGANANKDLVSYLQGVVKDFQTKPAGTSRYEQLMASVKPADGVPTDYQSLDRYAKGISEKQLDFLRPGGMGTDASRTLGELHGTARDVLDQVAAKTGDQDFINATTEANQFYRDKIAKPYYDNPEVSSLMSENTPDVRARGWQGMTPQQIGTLSEVMGPKGNNALSSQAIQDAISHATDPTKRMGFQFNPVKFSAFIQDHQGQMGVHFSPDDLAGINKMSDLFNTLQNAGSVPHSGTVRRMLVSELSTAAEPLTGTTFGKSFLLSPGSTPIGPGWLDELLRGAISKQGASVPAALAGQLQSGSNPAFNNQ
jgi:hypothetical protein